MISFRDQLQRRNELLTSTFRVILIIEKFVSRDALASSRPAVEEAFAGRDEMGITSTYLELAKSQIKK